MGALLTHQPRMSLRDSLWLSAARTVARGSAFRKAILLLTHKQKSFSDSLLVVNCSTWSDIWACKKRRRKSANVD